jgi:surface-anchored protein
LATSYYTAGHADLGLGDGDALELHLHCHAGATVDGIVLPDPGQEYPPTTAVIVVPESTVNYVHSIGGANADVAANMGLSVGNDYWLLPDTLTLATTLHAPQFGLGAEDLNSGVFDGDSLTLSLLSMSGSGPMAGGQFGLQNSDSWFITTADGITASDTIEGIPVGLHEHFNWYFTKPGDYEMTFEVSALVGGVPESDINTFTFQVVPEPSSLVLLASAISAGVMLFIFRRRQEFRTQ